MAINDTENPEEGTPRSKKDIRKERRQMRAVNRERKSMGGEPLYSKEEIKGVKEPFKPAPGEIVAGTPVIVDDTPDVEYIKYEPGGPGVESKTFSKEFKGGTAEAQAVTELAKGETTEKNAIIEALRKEADQKPDKTFTSSVEENKNINAIGNVVNEKINEANQEIVSASEQVKQQQAQEKVPGSGESVISKLDEIGPGITWDQTYKSEGLIPESREDIFNRAAASARKQAPQLAIEKLGVQDYYPDISRNIAVGTFTGSRIGSRTIYSGAGGLLPLGLYDARKRAIAAEIKRKEALMDELKSVPDIAKQFKPAWTNYVFDKWANYMEAYKNNPDGLANDLGFAKTNAQLKAIAENFKDVDAYVDDFKKKLMDSNGNAAAWATPRMLEIGRKFAAGYTPEKLEEYFSGKKNIAELKQTVEAIPNGYNHIDKRLNELLKDGNKVKRAITPKDGVEWTPDLQNKINDLSQQVTDGSIDYERYVSIMKEYFDIDFSPMINEWVDANNLGALTPEERKAYKQSLQIYAEAQIPAASFIPTIVTQNNDSASRYATDVSAMTAAKRMAFEAEQNKLDRESSPTKLDIEDMLEKGDKVKTVKTPETRIVDESPDDAVYNVYDPQQGKFRQVTGASIKRDQKSGYKYYDRSGKNLFEVPTKPIQYQQGTITYYNSNGNVKAISKGTAYTTKYDSITGNTELVPLNVDVSLQSTDMTKSSGVVDNSRAVEKDIFRGVNVSDAAKKTGGTGSYVTGSGSSRRY